MERRTVRALLIEDDPSDAELFRESLPLEDGFQMTWVQSVAAALGALESQTPEVVILDLTLPDANELGALATVKATSPHMPIVVLTGHDNEDLALRALQHGAQDYLVKGHVDRRGLVRSLRYAIERQRFEQERELFLSAVGHDLRNPLSAVRMAASLVLSDDDVTPRVRGRVAKIASSAERMNRLIEQLLSFARGRSGSMTLERRAVDLVELCMLVVDEVELAHPDANVVFAAPPTVLGTWDHDRLVQVVQNLVTNAVVHGTPGSPIYLRLALASGVHVIEVENDGPLISDAELNTLFHPFRRTRARGPGLGLGLSIAHQIVAAHGGTIAVRARQGGVVFTVRLPIDDETKPTIASPAVPA